MFVGDMLKVETETIIRRLRPELQMRLRFISHLSVGDIPPTVDSKVPYVFNQQLQYNWPIF